MTSVPDSPIPSPSESGGACFEFTHRQTPEHCLPGWEMLHRALWRWPLWWNRIFYAGWAGVTLGLFIRVMGGEPIAAWVTGGCTGVVILSYWQSEGWQRGQDAALATFQGEEFHWRITETDLAVTIVTGEQTWELRLQDFASMLRSPETLVLICDEEHYCLICRSDFTEAAEFDRLGDFLQKHLPRQKTCYDQTKIPG